jgi:hypothetical protein
MKFKINALIAEMASKIIHTIPQNVQMIILNVKNIGELIAPIIFNV